MVATRAQVSYMSRIGSSKQPIDKILEGGCLRELLAESLACVDGY